MAVLLDQLEKSRISLEFSSGGSTFVPVSRSGPSAPAHPIGAGFPLLVPMSVLQRANAPGSLHHAAISIGMLLLDGKIPSWRLSVSN